MRLRGPRAAAALLLAGALAGAVPLSSPPAAAEEPPAPGNALEALDGASRAIVERCGPAVVRVDAERVVHLRMILPEGPAREGGIGEAAGVGGAEGRSVEARESVAAAGFLVDAGGLVVTTAAVAGGRPAALRVTFPGGVVREGALVGEDPLSGVALLRVEPVEGVKPLPLADGEAAPGAVTLLLAPSGSHPTLRLGFVTEARRAFGPYDAWLVSSVGVAPGQAGAPLLDARGGVLGLEGDSQRVESGAHVPGGGGNMNAGDGFHGAVRFSPGAGDYLPGAWPCAARGLPPLSQGDRRRS